MDIRNNQHLQSWIEQGHRPKFIFFWGHRKPRSGVNKSCFSQWFESSFSENGERYKTAEHFMMAEKARLFNAPAREKQIINSISPGEAKKLGRSVENFDNNIWEEHRFEIVIRANLLKFNQNSSLKRFLISTGERILVEASPVDKIWGIGMAEDNPDIEDPTQWKGLNLLGYALMEVRARLKQE